MSTTGASEALSLFLVLASLALFDAGRMRALAASGLVLTLACAVRYDTWLLAGLMGLLVLVHGRDRRAALGRAAVFGLCCAPFPLVWLYGNWRAMGDPLYPIHYVESFHKDWLVEGLRTWGEASLRIQNAGFWPGVAVMTLGPLAATAGMAGMGWAFRARRDVRWVLWIAWAPAAYFTLRGAVLLDFQPLARFTVGQLALLLPFLKPGADLLLRGASRAWAAIGAASIAAFTVGLAAYTNDARSEPAHSLLPLSPLSRNPPEVGRLVALFDAQGASPADFVLIDTDDPEYRDLQVAFSIHQPRLNVVRRRWPEWEQSLGGIVPTWLIRFDGGQLEKTPGVELAGTALRFGGRWYDEVPGAPEKLHLYRLRR
jgi:hypothetical protein